jgi:oxygen-dependent protoporphyrinogen oxidase
MRFANDSISSRPTVVVIGAGVAGLSAACRLVQSPLKPHVVVVESQNRPGGLIHTVQRDGFLIEEAADGFVPNQVPSIWHLCQATNLDDELVAAQSRKHQAVILHRGRWLPVPAGFLLLSPTKLWPLVTTRLLGVLGKLRLAIEPLVPALAEPTEETIAQFASRRLGRQVYERLVRPIVESLYGADPATLSMPAVLPRFTEMEKQFGSLYSAARKQVSKGNTSGPPLPRDKQLEQLNAPRDGMSSLVNALARQLPENTIRLNAPVKQLVFLPDGRWRIFVAGKTPEVLTANAIIIATPANCARQLLTRLDHRFETELNVEYGRTVHVNLGYQRHQVARLPNSLGLFVPPTARRHIRSVTLSSEKFPNRAPAGAVLFRVALQPTSLASAANANTNLEAAALPTDDDELVKIAAAGLATILGIQGRPAFQHVVRHPQALPKYIVGHCQRVARLEYALVNYPSMALAGAAYRGIGVPQCVRSGEDAADRLLRYFHDRAAVAQV